MVNAAPNPYSPDRVPVEIPFSAEEVANASKKDSSNLLMIASVIIFVLIICFEAVYLVKNGVFDSRSKASFQGPTLQQ